MKIAVLDNAPLSDAYLDWSGIKQMAECSFYDRTLPEDIVPRAKDCEGVLVNKVVMGKSQIDSLPKLKYIGVMATGCNNVDLPYCRKRDITVCNIPQYSTNSVAEATFAHLLNFATFTETNSVAIKNGAWQNSPDFCCINTPLEELAGKTIALIGYGAIGKKVAKIARAFDMKVLAYAPSKTPNTSDGVAAFTDLDFLFKNADIISLHCPLCESNKKIINAQNLAKCKDGIWLINTARGGLVDEQALADALNSGKVAFAGIDVLSTEPPKNGNVLLGVKNCHITAHTAWATKQAKSRLLKIAEENLRMYLNNKPQNLV